ncbi:Fibronectin type 3 and ankyrin repeat domains like protein [Argiope bruennichi]|uniref:Fibronectin type 3 and ankyrin repeat domains like protein n=1 Tax=Argiope bruennichi TaxID=94029 RepID=A0A8T0E8X7_ARGBR|nr:Fibronectin type 3 and ankyrin repeat domains like protein [Argiope bruennichi]
MSSFPEYEVAESFLAAARWWKMEGEYLMNPHVSCEPGDFCHTLSWILNPKNTENRVVVGNYWIQEHVRQLFNETVPAAWLPAEGCTRLQTSRIVTMATRLLVGTGPVVLPVEYLFFPLQEAVRTMDRFIPSSKQPQHWSRNYNGSQDRRRSNARRRGASPVSEGKTTTTYGQGITLRAEDLLGESENRLGRGSGIPAVNFLTPKQGDRRAALGGSATELTKCERPKAPLRRSSEGSYALRRQSSSSSNAADDPTSSDPSTSCSASSSSSSESGCNADSETCNYCRLSESSDSCECRDSTDGERSSSSPDGNETRRPRCLTRALSEDCYPPSKSRPIRRTSPGEYLRHKRIQMEKLRNERLNSPNRRGITFQRCDSDPRLYLKKSEDVTPQSRALNFVSPTRNRMRQSHGAEPELMVVNQVILPVPQSTNPTLSESGRPKRSALAKNVAERRNRAKERQPSLVWNAEDSTPFLECTGVMFKCAVCESDIPFTNCVLCDAETKGHFFNSEQGANIAPEFPNEQQDTQNSNDDSLIFSDDRNSEMERLAAESQSSEEKKELEEFYDTPTPADTPPSINKEASHDKKAQWSSKGAIHKSFNYEENAASRRRNSLRKYNSEPVPEKDAEDCYVPSRSQADAPISRYTPQERSQSRSENTQSRAESSGSSSSKSEKRSGYHIAKDSPKRTTPEEQSVSSCPTCDVAEEDKTKENSKERVLSPDSAIQERAKRKSPTFLKPEFVFEPEIIHKANVLLPMGVDIDCLTAEGFTPLHLAVMNGHLDCIQTLLRWGASMDKRDALGRGVYEMVDEYNLEDVASLLRRFHKKLHNFKHVLDMIKCEGRSSSEIPQEYMDILASIAEESGTE